MNLPKVVDEALREGLLLWVEDGRLRYRGDKEAVNKALPALRAHRAEILQALGRCRRMLEDAGFPPWVYDELAPEDVADVVAGYATKEQLRAFARAVAQRRGKVQRAAGDGLAHDGDTEVF